MSEKFYRNLDKIAGRNRNAGLDVTVEIVREAFDAAMGKVPAELTESLYLHFLDGFNKSDKPETEFVEAAYRLGPCIDLFRMEYDEKQDPLPEDDWPVLREIVSDSAGELDLKILTYVMGKIVEEGKI
jgi:hypothetical protein